MERARKLLNHNAHDFWLVFFSWKYNISNKFLEGVRLETEMIDSVSLLAFLFLGTMGIIFIFVMLQLRSTTQLPSAASGMRTRGIDMNHDLDLSFSIPHGGISILIGNLLRAT